MMTVMGAQQDPGAQASPRHNDAIGDAFSTIMKLEPNIVPLSQELVATSIAVSLKRIANAVEQIAGSTTNASYGNSLLRDNITVVGDKIANAIAEKKKWDVGGQ